MLFDALKASSSIDATEILFSIILGSCFLMEGGWFECLLMYVVLVLGFVYTWYLPDIRSSEMSRKFVELAAISIVMLKPAFLNIFYLIKVGATRFFYNTQAVISIEADIF